jgi:spoIIIJ-associated protein
LEKYVNIARELMICLLERMEIRAEVDGSIKEGNVCLEIRGDKDGILIGKHGRTLEALQVLMNRIINKQAKDPVRVLVDIDHYRDRRSESLARMASRLGERVKSTGEAVTIGPYTAQERRVIHVTLKEDPALKTESLGEGVFKRLTISPQRKEETEI